MLIALTKLADIAVRSLFVLLVLYALPVRETGQFGLTLTLLGLYAFAVGFERYLDLQRNMVNASALDCDRQIVDSLRFFALNHLLWLPVLMLLLSWWVKLPVDMVLASAVVAVAEQVCNEVYRISMIVPRYRLLLFAALARNILLLALVAGLLWRDGARLQIDDVLLAWAACSTMGVAVIAVGFTRLWSFEGWSAVRGHSLGWRDQCRASRTHFQIGLVAMATLQLDRLMAGGLLSLDQSGQYFRHAFLASFAYQVFNVASYNRLAPRLYADIRSARHSSARLAIRHEYRVLVPGAAAVAAGFYAAAYFGAGTFPVLRTIDPNLLALLTAGYLVRTLADFNALRLYAHKAERQVLLAQLMALFGTLAFNISLTPLLGMVGPMVSLGLTAIVYSLATMNFLRPFPPMNSASEP